MVANTTTIGRQRLNTLLQWGVVVVLGVVGVTLYKHKRSSPNLPSTATHNQAIAQPSPSALPQGSMGIVSGATPVPSPTPIATESVPPTPSPTTLPNLPTRTISTCNGIVSDANLRSTPTLQEWAISGVISVGQPFSLTGRRVQADGETWHEIIAPYSLPAPGQQTQVSQRGWIASCFVR